jgi:hypothetical protein
MMPETSQNARRSLALHTSQGILHGPNKRFIAHVDGVAVPDNEGRIGSHAAP